VTKKLKIKLTTIGIIFFSFINLNAQNYEFGIAAGFDIASLHLTNSSVFGDFLLSPELSLRGGINL